MEEFEMLNQYLIQWFSIFFKPQSEPKMQTFFSDIRNLPRLLTRTRVGRRDGSPCKRTGSLTRKRFNRETPFQSAIAKDVKSAPLKCIRDKKK